jgi:hypothetical protein
MHAVADWKKGTKQPRKSPFRQLYVYYVIQTLKKKFFLVILGFFSLLVYFNLFKF